MVIKIKNEDKYEKIDEFIKKIFDDSKPIETKKITLLDVDIPRKRKIVNTQETGFVCNEFEIILDAEQD